MSKKRIFTAVAAVIALVIGIILIGANGSANAAKQICSVPYFRIAPDTPRSTFVEIYGDKGERRSFSTRGQMIVVKQETRSWDVCGSDRTYRFVKIGDGVWTLA